MPEGAGGEGRRKRSHAPSLLTNVARTLRDDRLVLPGDRVLCACSGGPDSTALLHVLATLREPLGFQLDAHGVDHGLRAEASIELAHARDLCDRLGVSFEVTRVEVAPGSNLQARARAARLEALALAASSLGAAAIATGHTADDRAETVLIRLLRGAGPRGLAVLPPSAPLPEAARRGLGEAGRAVRLIRPLIRARRAEVMAHVGRHALRSAQDPSNADPRFLRVRVRREVLPLLEQLAPRIVESLCALAEMLEREPDEDEALAKLGRAQRASIDRARRLGRASLLLRVRGGRELRVTFPNGRVVLTDKA